MSGDAGRPGDRRVGGMRRAEQHRLRQRRFLVRLAVFLGDLHDRGVRVLLPRANRREGAGRATADDEDRASRVQRASSLGRLTVPDRGRARGRAGRRRGSAGVADRAGRALAAYARKAVIMSVDVVVAAGDHHHQRPRPQLRQRLRQRAPRRIGRADDERRRDHALMAAGAADDRGRLGVAAGAGDHDDQVGPDDLDRRPPIGRRRHRSAIRRSPRRRSRPSER